MIYPSTLVLTYVNYRVLKTIGNILIKLMAVVQYPVTKYQVSLIIDREDHVENWSVASLATH